MQRNRIWIAGSLMLGALPTVFFWGYGRWIAPGRGVHSDLWYTLGLFGVALIVALWPPLSEPLRRGPRVAIGICAVLALGVALVNFPWLWTRWQEETRAAEAGGFQARTLASLLQGHLLGYLWILLAGLASLFTATFGHGKPDANA